MLHGGRLRYGRGESNRMSSDPDVGPAGWMDARSCIWEVILAPVVVGIAVPCTIVHIYVDLRLFVTDL